MAHLRNGTPDDTHLSDRITALGVVSVFVRNFGVHKFTELKLSSDGIECFMKQVFPVVSCYFSHIKMI